MKRLDESLDVDFGPIERLMVKLPPVETPEPEDDLGEEPPEEPPRSLSTYGRALSGLLVITTQELQGPLVDPSHVRARLDRYEMLYLAWRQRIEQLLDQGVSQTTPITKGESRE